MCFKIKKWYINYRNKVTTQCGLPQRHRDAENNGIALFLLLFVELRAANEIFRFNFYIALQITNTKLLK